MKQPIRSYFVGWALIFALILSPKARAIPDAGTLSKDCYTKVGPLLRNGGGKLSLEVRKAYLDWAEKTVLDELREGGQTVPESCLAETRHEGTLRDAIYGSVFPPDPSILQNYAQLRTELGPDFLAHYRSLVIAISVARRIKGVEKPAQSKEIGRDYQPGFWTDESLQVPGSEPEKAFVRQIAAYMKDSQVSAIDLYQNAELQGKLKEYLSQHNIAVNFQDEVRKSVGFGERLKNAMVVLGQRPAAREPKPGAVVWLRHLAALNEAMPASTPTADGKPMPWPLFPVDRAPWPLLMPLAHPIPLSEANYIWKAFQGEYGSDRYHTYGPYRGDDDVMPDSLKPSKWFWDAWPDRIVHGGMCVPISKGTVDLYTGLCKPAMWAGQPGHANLISFQFVGGAWTAEIEQAFAGGPDVTTAQWYFDEDPGTQIRYRDLYFWAGAEYHLGLALGMNVGLKSYMDTRLAANIFKTIPPEDRPTLGAELLRTALLDNPFNPEIWYRLAEQASDAKLCLALSEAALKGNLDLLTGQSGAASPEKHGKGNASAQYWQTVAQFVTQYALLAHTAPTNETEMRRAYSLLKTIPGVGAGDIAHYAEKFTEKRPAEAGMDPVAYDKDLASKGDAFGQLRMGQRFLNGDGIAKNENKAKDCLTLAAAQGDPAAAVLLGNLNPCIPADQITVTASTEYSPNMSRRLVDGSGLLGAAHDNNEGAQTMWHTANRSIAHAGSSAVAGLGTLRFCTANEL